MMIIQLTLLYFSWVHSFQPTQYVSCEYCLFGCFKGSCLGACQDNYFPSLIETNYRCQKCKIHQCQDCGIGNYYSQGICQPCKVECHQCIVFDHCSCEYPCLTCDAGGCVKCVQGYQLIQRQCNQIMNTNTLQTRLLSFVSQCLPGEAAILIMIDLCSACQDLGLMMFRCFDYDMVFKYTCINSNGYSFPDPDPNTLLQCGSCNIEYCVSCLTLSGQENCYYCSSGYYLDSSTTPQRCIQCGIGISENNYFCDSDPPDMIYSCNIPTCTQCQMTCNKCLYAYCYCLQIQDAFIPLYAIDVTCPYCLDGYYKSSTDRCSLCPSMCVTCDSTTCLTCIYPCSTCTFTTCLSCIANYYLNPLSICVHCDLSCQTCDSFGCFSSLSNIIEGQSVVCLSCKSGYYLQSNYCNKCSPQCSECSIQSVNCLKCNFPIFSIGSCNICESQYGMYSNFINNTCYTICGDGIQAGNEECDDGNLSPSDGCTNCQIDSGYQCDGLFCSIIIYPIPILKQITTKDNLYLNQKLLKLQYNIAMQSFDIQSLVSLQISNNVNFTYIRTRLDNQNYNLTINLTNISINSEISLQFSNATSIISLQGDHQQTQNIRLHISDFIIISETYQYISEKTNQVTYNLLIVLLVLVCLAILFGGLDIFWNLLDLIQIISYLKFLNTTKSIFLDDFLDLFQFVQFQYLPMNQYLNIQNTMQNYMPLADFKVPPSHLQDDGYTTSTIINSIPILNIFLLGFTLYYIVKIIFYLISKLNFNINVQTTQRFLKIYILLYKIQQFICQWCLTFIDEWLWSGIIRIILSSAFDISLMISLGLMGIQFDVVQGILLSDASLTVGCLLLYVIWIYNFSIILSKNRNALKYEQQQYGAIYEGLKNKQFTKYFNIFLMIKKLLFMMILVLLSFEPIIQVISIIVVELIHILYLIVLNPLIQREEGYKQLISEIFILLAQLQLGVLIVDDYIDLLSYEYRDFYNLICVCGLVLTIIIQLVINSYQQFQEYKKRYRLVRRILEWFPITQQKQITRPTPNIHQ